MKNRADKNSSAKSLFSGILTNLKVIFILLCVFIIFDRVNYTSQQSHTNSLQYAQQQDSYITDVLDDNSSSNNYETDQDKDFLFPKRSLNTELSVISLSDFHTF